MSSLSQDLARDLLGAASDAIIEVRDDGWIVLANVQAERLFCYPREDLIGQPIEILVPRSTRGVHSTYRIGYFTATATATATVDVDYIAGRPGLEAGRHVRLSVQDSGVGMSADTLARVSEPFFTTKPKGAGSGLGLAPIYGIIAQAGGHAEITSEIGVRTTVSGTIPATDAVPITADEQPLDADPARSEATILVVEDEDALREVTRRILTRNGYQVLTAPSALEACSIAIEHHGDIHLLLTDIIMPRMQGRELANRIRAARPAIRVLYMSGYTHPILTTQGKLDAGVYLLEKPFSKTVLLEKVREALDSP
ncbi:PAS domain-containing sensor histidine kinase [Frankia tisae]|uniref:PAS domain-containing sensor histidine kinase n=1 Tax=Frankia tisae TaxID=2950104 RepID=UPI0027E27EF4|nr:response regulator [Frankia tisae]